MECYLDAMPIFHRFRSNHPLGSELILMSSATHQPHGFGAPLQAAREARRQNLHSLAERLCLRSGVLKALEEERTDDLPEPLLARGYLRQYAKLLELDAEPLLRLYPAKTRHSPETFGDPPSSKQRLFAVFAWRLLPTALALLGLLWVLGKVLIALTFKG
jgi:cytoskeletal protein RodZ